MQRVEGVVRHYDWGDTEFIPRLLGGEPDGRPWAELWLGTHPAAPASLEDGTPLADVAGDLPYLLKVLAADAPLSLQAHPTTEQARDGHARGVFADPFAKPELLCALTPFLALCGFRPVDATVALLHDLGAVELARAVADDGPRGGLEGLLRGDLDHEVVVAACDASDRAEADCVRRLVARYPGDPAAAAALLLNLVTLAPGEALRLDAGNLHAYVHGAGIELMGPSDNVVRAGLTSKPVDVDLLLEVVDGRPVADPVLPATGRHDLPAAGVSLLRLEPGDARRSTGHELSIDLLGAARYCAPDDELVADAVTYVVASVL